MSASRRYLLSQVMNLAWQFVKMNGFSMAEAMKAAWANMKLKAKMAMGIVRFYFRKVDGSIREAYGTLKQGLVPQTGESNRRTNPTVQVYFDTEKGEFRCFKKANLIF